MWKHQHPLPLRHQSRLLPSSGL
uniref:Uncharacterized protein n=1 Tax=Arundo donax TaxID=35708 RepID=A0A0A8ZU90_ARUDO